MFKRLIAAALVFGAAATAPPLAAHAQQPVACGPRAILIERLETHFGERRHGAGLGGEADPHRTLVELFTSPETGSWTIILTRVDGISCILAAGQHWRDAPKEMAQIGDGV